MGLIGLDPVTWFIGKVLMWGGDRCPDPHIPQSASFIGCDDKWPDEEYRSLKDSCQDDEVMTTIQWGLRLPNGEVQWGSWSGISFTTPLDRLKMVATLQKTALDMGLSEGKQIQEFLEKYKWQTRQRRTRISYIEAEEYALADPAVSAAPVENSNDDYSQDNSESFSYDSHRNVCAGSVGGDA